MKLKATNPHKCPVCGQTEFPFIGSNLICDVCKWEDDSVQETEPDLAGGANKYSLNENRKRWANGEYAK
ncbi:MAG: hypothetical protein J6I96_05505 [Oscillospiraceae bacterium]|nr:hypothetical protein [Oscillospiraceae bacterium]